MNDFDISFRVPVNRDAPVQWDDLERYLQETAAQAYRLGFEQGYGKAVSDAQHVGETLQ